MFNVANHHLSSISNENDHTIWLVLQLEILDFLILWSFIKLDL